MKHKNVKVGQQVKVKKSTKNNYHRIGKVGIVIEVEPLDYDGDLTVLVSFDGEDKYGCISLWFNHKDIKLIKVVDTINNAELVNNTKETNND